MKTNFSRVIELVARRYGDREALVNLERNRRYTYRQYHALTNRIANAMSGALGLGASDKAMLILENDSLSLVSFVAYMKQAATVAVTNLRDSIAEHAWQIELIKPKAVFIESRLLDDYYDMLRGHGCEIVVMDEAGAARPGVRAFWPMVEAASPENPDIDLDLHDHIALLRFTGGTTGRGKCAMYSIDNLMAVRDAALAHPDLAFNTATRFLHVTPLSHASQIGFIPTIFMGGTTLTLNQVDLERWRAEVEAERVTHALLVPTVLYRLLELQRARPRDLGSLRSLLYGASPMSPTRLGELLEIFGPIFAQGYASTEASMFLAMLDKADHIARDDAAARRLSSAGRITPGVEVDIIDSAGRKLAAGEIGEIRVRCRALIKGYYGNPEGTAAEFVDDAWKSGDLGYIDEDGYLFIVDRLKDMIISGGFNVYAVEVEAALAAHPAVFMSAVVGKPHPEWGEAVHAEVVLKPGQSVAAEELIAHAKDRIGSYKAPKSIAFVASLPVSAVGKVLRKDIKEKYWQGLNRGVN